MAYYLTLGSKDDALIGLQYIIRDIIKRIIDIKTKITVD